MYNCMFVSALPDPTCNSEKSANGGNKQILFIYLFNTRMMNDHSLPKKIRENFRRTEKKKNKIS